MDFRKFIEDIMPQTSFNSAPLKMGRAKNTALVATKYIVSYILPDGSEREAGEYDERDEAYESYKEKINRLPLGASGVRLSFGKNSIDEYQISPDEYSVYMMYNHKQGVRVQATKNPDEAQHSFEFRKNHPGIAQKGLRLYKGSDLLDEA